MYPSKYKMMRIEKLKPLNNNVVYTIRKKENQLKKLNWWKQDNKKEYYSNTLDDKRFIYAFFNQDDATRCLEFLNKYKKINGVYPTEQDRIKNIIPFEIFIEEEAIYYLKHNCLLNNVGLMGIYSFDYTQNIYGKFDVDFKGQDLLEQENINLRTMMHQLEHLLDTNF
jgi:hypothetical protein